MISKKRKQTPVLFFAPSHVMEIDLTSLSCFFQQVLSIVLTTTQKDH